MVLLVKELTYMPDSLSAFTKLRRLGNGFLLDSGNGYADCVDVFSASPSVLQSLNTDAGTGDLAQLSNALKKELESYPVSMSTPYPLPGWYGLCAYDMGAITEAVPLKKKNASNRTPTAHFGFYPSVVVTDHSEKRSYLYGLKRFQAHFDLLLHQLNAAQITTFSQFELTTAFRSCWSFTEYQQQFNRVIEYIRAGDCYQVNLAHRFSAQFKGDAWQGYHKLRQSFSAPMASFFEAENWSLLSVSPERFIRCTNGTLETKPIKGTRPKLQDPKQDRQQIRLLEHSEKDRAENLMIVDLLRNDLGRSCVSGSIQVPSLFSIESFSNVHHLVSTITGELKQNVSPIDALLAAFPGGSITGAPKHRAMEIIDELEAFSRNFYCGSTVYWDVAGKLDSSILIRSLVTQGSDIECWAGGGIVADSTADQEYQETLDKVGNIIKTLS